MSTKDLTLNSLEALETVVKSEDYSDDDDDDVSAAYSEDTEPSVSKVTTSMKERAAKNERDTLGAKETRNIQFLRFFTFLILLLTAILVCLGVYFYTKRDEEDDFEYVYGASAERVIQSFHESVAQLLAGVDAGAVAITSYALNTGANFPYVTMPDWELRAANTRVITKSITFQWFPLVQEEDRLGWEAYANETHMQQIKTFMSENEFITRQDNAFGLETNLMIPGGGEAAAATEQENAPEDGQNATEVTPSDPANRAMQEQGGQADQAEAAKPLPLMARPFSPQLINLMTGQIQDYNTGPYLPFWQTSPALPFPILPSLNILSDPQFGLFGAKVIESNKGYLSNTIETGDLPGFTLKRGQYRHNQELFLGDAFTTLTYPVFDNFSTSRKLVGVVLADIYWRLHFEQVLPPNARGVIAVLENNVNQSFTYQLDGPDVTYLGEGDLHDEAFDHMLVSADVSEFLSTYASVETEGFTAVPLSGEGVQYSLRVYPSQDMKDDFVTNQPVIFSLIVALVFVFTSGVFFIYNVLVERRQKIVMDRAVKSTAVVSSLFPENVKELLLNEGEEERDKKVSWRASERKQDLNNNTVAMMSETRPKGKPIADRFENTTIIFADIAGFTSWSSEREPEHVFELLETLYAAFDALALARSVFKVETIGDCYLAITGVPKPQPDHAIRMVKFARDCMHKVKDLINSLAESLGDDTRNLSFRVGLHSGSVTAGVLRGDKSRFQLFGDTVNTAARMESHGIKGRIHVSQSTADELVKAGKPGWIVPRQDKISAKGKGDLQTYFMDERFMNVKVGKSTASVSSPSLESSEIGDSDGDDHST